MQSYKKKKKKDIHSGLGLDIGLEVKVDANGCQHAGTHQRRHHRLVYKEIQNKSKYVRQLIKLGNPDKKDEKRAPLLP